MRPMTSTSIFVFSIYFVGRRQRRGGEREQLYVLVHGKEVVQHKLNGYSPLALYILVIARIAHWVNVVSPT